MTPSTPCGWFYSQVGDPSFAHSAGDGFHRRAQRVQQRRQLPGAFCLPALLHDEAGHGDHVGVEGRLIGHGCRWSPLRMEVGGNAAGLKCSATRNSVEEVKTQRPIQSCRRGVALLQTLSALYELNWVVMK